MALFILRIKEVVPLHQPNKDIANFFHHDVKIARDYYKTIRDEDEQLTQPPTLTLHHGNLAHSIVKRWKSFKATTSQESQQDSETGPSGSINDSTKVTNTESRRKLLHLKTFAKDYDLDVFNKNDYDLLTTESRERAHLLISDLVDMCQEIPHTLVGLYHLQPTAAPTPTDKGHASFYQEIIALLPPKWYQLFVREQQRRKMLSWSSSLNRVYSLRAPARSSYRKSISEPNENDSPSASPKQKKLRFQRQNSAPGTRRRSSSIPAGKTIKEVPVEDTRFRIASPTIISQTFDESEYF